MQLGVRKYFQAIIGITFIGVGVAFNYLADLGLGPWGVFHDGISKTIGITSVSYTHLTLPTIYSV